MKKGIVMELHRKYTIIMTEEGSFQKTIPVKDAEIGTEVVYEPLKVKKASLFFFYPGQRLNVPIRLLAMACIVLLFITPFYFLAGNEETYAYVNIEINPSIELEIDEGLNVQAIEPLNKDASRIVEELTDYQNKNIETVIEMIMSKSEASGLIKNGKNMLVGVSYVAEDKAKNTTIINHLKSYFKQENPNWKIAAFKVPKDIREKAQNSNKSMNEVMATTIIEKDSDTVGNINDNINDNDKAIINSFYDNKNKPENSDEKTDNNKPGKTSLKIKEKQSDNHKRDINNWNSPMPDVKKESNQNKNKDKAKNNEHKSNKRDKKDKHANNHKGKEHKHQNNGNHYGGNKGKSKKKHPRNPEKGYEKDKEHPNKNKRPHIGNHNNHQQKKHNKKGKHP